jgi:hypothetical protein
MTNKEKRELVAYFRSEIRRCAFRPLCGPAVVFKPTRLVVKPAPVQQPAMSMPAVLLAPDTEAGIQRFADLAFGKQH